MKEISKQAKCKTIKVINLNFSLNYNADTAPL